MKETIYVKATWEWFRLKNQNAPEWYKETWWQWVTGHDDWAYDDLAVWIPIPSSVSESGSGE